MLLTNQGMNQKQPAGKLRPKDKQNKATIRKTVKIQEAEKKT